MPNPSNVPDRRETTDALWRLLRSLRDGRFPDQLGLLDDAELQLAAIERQREELRQDAENLVTQIKTWRWLNWGKIAPWVCDCGHVHGEGVPAGEPCDECGMKKPCKEDRDEFYHAARLSGSPAATSEKPNDA